MLFGVYAAFWRANGGGPVIFAAHHHAFYKGLAAHVGFYGAVFGKRAAQVAFFLFGHGLGSFLFFARTGFTDFAGSALSSDVSLFLRGRMGVCSSFCLRGTRRAHSQRPHP